MPTLDWIGKAAVVRHHAEVPFRLLEEVPGLSCPLADGGDTENLIVQGDNLEALKALLPRYAGQVKCIYIDPPYNTGNEGWVYNDAVNSPEIRQWLGKVVGKEAEDLSRHDKWLCMMYPRLVLLRQFLREDGAIFISIDDNEVAPLRLLMDEIFGRHRFVATCAWQKRYSRENRGAIGDVHEYLVVYAAEVERFKEVRNRVPLNADQTALYKSSKDPRGPWQSVSMTAQGWRPNQMYEIVAPNGKKHSPPEGRCWAMTEPEFMKLREVNKIYFGKDGNGVPRIMRFLSEVEGLVPWTWWPHEDVGHTDEARKEVQSLFGTQTAFDTPKPTRLIQRILQIATNPGDLILDSFAGSGTTGHAVLRMNASGRVGVPPAGSGILPEPETASGATYTRRRRLPHFEKPWAIYAVTFVTMGRRELSPRSRTHVLDALRHFHGLRYELFAACVMPDHVHLLVQPWIKEQNDRGESVFWPLGELMHSIKSFTAKAINKEEGTRGSVWEQERFDRYVRGDRDLEEKFRYILENPMRAGLGEDYRWVWEPGCDEADGSGGTPEPAGGTPTQPGASARRFILCEIDEKIARDITAERVRRVAKGYTNTKGDPVEGLGGGFQFVKLGKTLFDETGAIRADVKFSELAEFVFFRETGRPLSKPARGERRTALLGTHEGRAVYLLFNGILGDRSVDGGNVLTGPILAQLAPHDGPKVIYAAACRLGRARLEAGQITFKQTPYDLQVP